MILFIASRSQISFYLGSSIYVVHFLPEGSVFINFPCTLCCLQNILYHWFLFHFVTLSFCLIILHIMFSSIFCSFVSLLAPVILFFFYCFQHFYRVPLFFYSFPLFHFLTVSFISSFIYLSISSSPLPFYFQLLNFSSNVLLYCILSSLSKSSKLLTSIS